MDRAGQVQTPVRPGPMPHRSLRMRSRWPADICGLAAFYLLLVAIAAYLAIMGPFDAGSTVTRAELGPAWPLTISTGTLHCEFGGEIVLQHRGTGYSLTGRDKHGAYTDIAEIQADDLDGGKKDLRPLIERGRRLCH